LKDPDPYIGFGLNPDVMASLVPDSESGSGYGSRRAKVTHKNRKKLNSFFEVLDVLF
jgi:hypothetical protein